MANCNFHRAINGSGCTNCYWHKRDKYKLNSLIVTHPDIAKDWHPIKNAKLTPDMFTKGSQKIIYWKCHICGDETIKSIKAYNGCKKCKKEKFLKNNNLTITHKELLKEWNYSKNKNISPTDITYSTNTKVWWKCSKCGYEWKARVNNRAIGNRGCPCCSNKVVVKGINDLATTHPNIAKEWHPTKNETLMPCDVTYGYGKKVWWLCPYGHEYQATVNKRTSGQGTNCPICNAGRQTSFAEQAFYFYIKQLYPDAISRYTAGFLGRMELDIFIPSIKLAIEYDGIAWHKENKLERERKKYKLCKKQGIKLIRMREKEAAHCSDICDIEFARKDLYLYCNLNVMIKELIRKIDFRPNIWLNRCVIDVDVERDKYKISEYCQPLKKDSLLDKFPNIAKEWHPTKNGKLLPSMVNVHTEKKVWWKCSKCGHEWETTIAHRTDKSRPTGCPKCARKRIAKLSSKAVQMIDPKTNAVIKIFNSISAASKELKINNSNISMVCKGQRNYAGGYIWKYVNKKDF